MQPLSNDDVPDVLPVSEAVVVDRRRPGRHDAHPALIRLLRAPAEVQGLAEQDQRFLDDDGNDRLASARGVLIGVLLAIPMWIVIGWLSYLLLRSY